MNCLISFLIAFRILMFQQEDYNIIYVKGEVKIALTNEILEKGKVISSVDSISFSSPNDIVIVIGSSSGKYVIKPLENERVSTQPELIYYVKNNLLPVRARSSSRDASSDIIDFLETNKFIVIDRLSFELDEEIELFLKAEDNYIPFSFSGNKYSMNKSKLGNNSYLPLYEKVDGDFEFLAEILVKRIDKTQILNELSFINEAFNDNAIEGVEDHLRGYIRDAFGYMTPMELNSLIDKIK